MCVMLAVLLFMIISGVHGAFSLSIYVHAQNIEAQNFSLSKF